MSDVGDIKVTVAKQEANLGALGKSVDYHIKRSDSLEEMVITIKADHAIFKKKIELNEVIKNADNKNVELKHEMRRKHIIVVLKTVLSTLSAVGATILALHELGLFKYLVQ